LVRGSKEVREAVLKHFGQLCFIFNLCTYFSQRYTVTARLANTLDTPLSVLATYIFNLAINIANLAILSYN
jgi:hypothetical protein